MIILPPALFADISRYALIANAGEGVAVSLSMPFDRRRKSVHRYTVADVNGPVALTVPVVKPLKTHGTAWNEIRISTHGSWWNNHRTALESAYGRTPYFEFYVDRLLPFFCRETPENFGSAAHLAFAAEKEICRIIGLTPPEESDAPVTADVRYPAITAPYWQIRADKLGFIPGLSVLDLIFSLGPESILYLKQ